MDTYFEWVNNVDNRLAALNWKIAYTCISILDNSFEENGRKKKRSKENEIR